MQFEGIISRRLTFAVGLTVITVAYTGTLLAVKYLMF